MRPAAGWLDALPIDRMLAEFSLWSADLGRLADEMARVDRHVDLYHIDVADGRFSSALLFFPDLTAVLRKLTTKPLHVHLMTSDDILLAQIEQFASAGADLISIHVENGNVDGALALIDRLGLPSGLVLQLETPIVAIAPFPGRVRFVTLLGTRIGIRDQRLDDEAPSRLRAARALIASESRQRRVILAADGGIREHTVKGLRKAGAETIVMGSLAFNADDLSGRMAWIHAKTT